MDWFEIKNIAAVDSPAVVVYPDRIKDNIRILKTFVTDVDLLRPHVKTNKSAEVTYMMLNAGITKFKCATPAEAEMLAMGGAPDVLIAHQPVGPKVARILELVRTYTSTKFSCIFDDEVVAKHISEIFKSSGKVIDVYIDINVGMNRSGILPEDAFTLWENTRNLDGIRVVGLHAYDGHLRDPDLTVRAKACDEAFARVEQLNSRIETVIKSKLKVVAGGTPTFPIHAKRKDVECSPGTFIYWDKGYEQVLKEQPFLFAALVVTRVISKPDDTTVCVDLGHKAIASENPIQNRVFFLNGPPLTPTGHSEEHLVLKTATANDLKVGDVLYGIPYHICPTIALHENVTVIEDGNATAVWANISRKRKITI